MSNDKLVNMTSIDMDLEYIYIYIVANTRSNDFMLILWRCGTGTE